MKNDKVMKRVSVIVGVIVLVATGACAWAYFSHGTGGGAEFEDGANLRRSSESVDKGMVVRATKDIPEGSLIDPSYLEELSIDQSKIPESAISSPALAAGLYASVPIAQGTVILQGHLKHISPPQAKTEPATKPKSGAKKKHG